MKELKPMSGGVKTFLVILLIPFLAGAGHDVYLNYFSNDEKIKQAKRLQINPEDFLASDLGWVWGNYHPASMEMARGAVEPEIWQSNVDPILQLPAMVVGLIPFALGVIYSLLAFVLGIWPFSRYGKLRKQKDDDFAVYKHAKSNAIKYTKK